MLARWLLHRRGVIESTMTERLGRLPAASSAEAEALRRFRSYVLLALSSGGAPPSLDGLRVDPRRAAAVVRAWVDAAAAVAGPEGDAVSAALEPLRERFVGALRETAPARRASGAARPGRRRAVAAAIDRVSDAFLAIDAASGTIADANPAAGALLGCTRDELLGADAMRFVPEDARDAWWVELDAVSEGAEPRRFRTRLCDAQGQAVGVEARVTRFASRARTLALVVARP